MAKVTMIEELEAKLRKSALQGWCRTVRTRSGYGGIPVAVGGRGQAGESSGGFGWYDQTTYFQRTMCCEKERT